MMVLEQLGLTKEKKLNVFVEISNLKHNTELGWDYSEPCSLTTTHQVPAIEDETSEEKDFIEMPLMNRCHETLDQTIDPNNKGSQNESKDEIEKHLFHGCLLDRLQNLQIHRDEIFSNNWDQWNISETSSPD